MSSDYKNQVVMHSWFRKKEVKKKNETKHARK